MITHIVFFKLKNPDQQTVQTTKEKLEQMMGRIPELKSLQVGVDIVRSQRSYDLALITTFDSLDDLEAYQVHPVHLEFVEYVNTVRESTVAVDFES
ncbi:Dabb family protein [Marinicrinis lubricantis]|uniref:Dabb family protein n=1 Tax=Marinicrinis lubricantis TaxID=2086470 RepID=A0ABW1IT82_9BACL